MKTLAAICCALVVALAAAPADGQVFAAYYPAPAFVAPIAPVVVAPPPVPVVTYYHAPVVAYTPGYYFGPAAVYAGPRAFTVRQRVHYHGYGVRSTYRVAAW